MFKLEQTTNNRWRVMPSNPDDWNVIPHHLVAALLWRSFPNAQEAFTFAAQTFFAVCDQRAAA